MKLNKYQKRALKETFTFFGTLTGMSQQNKRYRRILLIVCLLNIPTIIEGFSKMPTYAYLFTIISLFLVANIGLELSTNPKRSDDE